MTSESKYKSNIYINEKNYNCDIGNVNGNGNGNGNYNCDNGNGDCDKNNNNDILQSTQLTGFSQIELNPICSFNCTSYSNMTHKLTTDTEEYCDSPKTSLYISDNNTEHRNNIVFATANMANESPYVSQHETHGYICESNNIIISTILLINGASNTPLCNNITSSTLTNDSYRFTIYKQNDGFIPKWTHGIIFNKLTNIILYTFYSDYIDNYYDKYVIQIAEPAQFYKPMSRILKPNLTTKYNLYINSLIIYNSNDINDIFNLSIKIFYS